MSILKHLFAPKSFHFSKISSCNPFIILRWVHNSLVSPPKLVAAPSPQEKSGASALLGLRAGLATRPHIKNHHGYHLSSLGLTPPCVAESDQRHAQHPLKMLGIDFSCGSYQTNSERIMLLNSWYQIDMSLHSNRYLFVRSKIGGQKWQPHILCKTMMSFFASRLTPWFAWQPRAPAQKTTRADMQILYSLLSQYLRHSVLNNVRGLYEKCIVPGNKDFWIW